MQADSQKETENKKSVVKWEKTIVGIFKETWGWWWTGKKSKQSQECLAHTRIGTIFRIHSQEYHIAKEGNNTISTSQGRQEFKHCTSNTSEKKKKEEKLLGRQKK